MESVHPIIPRLLIIAVVFLTATSARAEVTVVTVDGENITGAVVAWTTEALTISSTGEITKIAAERMLAIHTESKISESNTIAASMELVDGTVLPLNDYTVAAHKASATTSLASQPLLVSTNDIRLLQFAPFENRVTELWDDLAGKQLEGDVLIVHKKKRTTVDFLTGLIGNVSGEQVVFNWDGDEIPVKISKVAALGYFHARLPQLPDPICMLKTTGGARIAVASINLSEEVLQVTTLGGMKLQIPLGSLMEADYSLGKLVYLSDLKPTRQQWIPQIELPETIKFIGDHGAARNDQSFAGSSLTLSWPDESSRSKSTIRRYQKGLALRSRTELEYRLPPQMQQFIAIAGIDPATADQGHVHLEISAGDQIFWQGEIDGSLPPTKIQFELNGTRQLRIFVDYGANLDYGDRLHLVEARVTK